MDGSIAYPASRTVITDTTITDANNAYPELSTSRLKVANYVCVDNVPVTGYWWTIESRTCDIFGTKVIIQNAQQVGGSNAVMYIREKYSDSAWTQWALV